MKNFKKLFNLLLPNERKQAGLLLLMMVVVAILDMIGVATIFPFMAVLTNPNLIETNIILNKMFHVFSLIGVENNQQFLFALGILVFVMLVISLFFRAITLYAQLKFVHMREYTISKRLVEGYLQKSYNWLIENHSADLGKNILSEAAVVVRGGMKQAMEMISKSLITIALIFLLIMTDLKLTLVIAFFLGFTYVIVFYIVHKYLKRIGKERFKSNELRFTSISDAFGAVKEIKVGGLEKFYIQKFSDPAKSFAHTTAFSLVITLLPRFVLEAIAFGGVLLILLYLMMQTGNLQTSLPIISLYVLAGYRLIPALQQIYGSFTQLTFIGPSLDKLYNDIINFKPTASNQNQDVLSLNREINLKNISYEYSNSSRAALKNINIRIPARSTVGLIGPSGSGKTTTVDIILGLLEAQKGTLEIDDTIVSKQNLRSWQRSIGYVPQHIFLANDTIFENIAFGVNHKDINIKAVEKASKIANLHNFIIEELPKQYNTYIGERGVRLSGGQRQRIGIARALYHNPQVLILDEATSALDNETEKAVMEAVNNLSKDITIILIAHRLNTVKNCDIVFKLEKGQLVNQGSFEKLINSKNEFI